MQKEGGEGKAVLSSVKCDVVEAVIITGSEGRGLFGDFYRKVTCRQIHIPLESF